MSCLPSIGLGIVAMSCSPLPADQISTWLSLEEESHHVLPPGLVPTGLVVDSSSLGRTVAWSRPDRRAWLHSGTRWASFELPSVPVGACLVAAHRIEVVDATGFVTILDELGNVRSHSLSLPSDSLVAAVCSNDAWYVLENTGSLPRTRAPRGSNRKLRESWPELPSAQPTEMILTTAIDGEQLLLTSSVWPFSIISFHLVTGQVTSFEPITTKHIPPELITGEGVWRSLGTIPVGRMYLRTLVDAQTDNRLLMVHGECGDVLRSTAIRAPIGFAASSGPFVYGIRNTGVAELVKYRWSLGEQVKDEQCNPKQGGLR